MLKGRMENKPKNKHLVKFMAGKTQREVAKTLDISEAYMSQILSADRRPSFELMCDIERMTKGSVPIKSWIRK